MSFQGYKLKFDLYASHKSISDPAMPEHFHNFTITLYIKSYGNELILFEKIEENISEWLEQYQNKSLHVMFIEAAGDALYLALKEKIEGTGFELIRLDISESPVHVYSVSEKILDGSVNLLEYSPLLNVSWNNPAAGGTFESGNHFAVENIESGSIADETAVSVTPAKENTSREMALTKEEPVTAEQVFSEIAAAKERGQSLTAFKFMLYISAILIVSLGIMYIVRAGGSYPKGSDIFCHIYRADLIFQSLKKGVFYPLYDPYWYNGVEIMRYWGPLPLYTLALMQYFAGGDSMNAYILFTGLIYIAGSLGWMLSGLRYNRMGLAFLLGILWFFQPENMAVFFEGGNLPRALIAAILPYLVYFMWNYLKAGRIRDALAVIFLQGLIGICHGGIAVMLFVTFALFLGIYGAVMKESKRVLSLLTGMLLAFALIGIWLYPALIGGGVTSGSSTNQVMKNFFQSLFVSLNPIYRLQGMTDIFYFGLPLFVLLVFGVIYGSKETVPAFLAAMLILFSTSKTAYEIFSRLPISQFLWMQRFIPGAVILALFAFLQWKKLKPYIMVLLCLALILDTLPSYRYIYSGVNGAQDVYTAQRNNADNLLISDAKKITSQRLAILDLSRYGAFAPYYVAGTDKRIKYTFGAGWEGAHTASNIVRLNTALAGGNYYYLFDRCLELGSDTVLIPTVFLENKEEDIDKIAAAAEKSGYARKENRNGSLLFHRNTISSFGVVTDYEYMAIGSSAKDIALLFPAFKEGDSLQLDSYTYEELKEYKKIYLSGFTYKNKKGAEELLTALAGSGTEIFIDMNKIPADAKTNRYELLGVSAQVISFKDYFPKLKYEGENYVSEMFADTKEEGGEDLSTWNTVYLDGIKEKEGTCNLDGTELVFEGTAGNKNIHFLGFNLPYHVLTSQDTEIAELLKQIFKLDTDSLPLRTIVPLIISYCHNKIIITSDYDNVNTTLSGLDILHGKGTLKTDNNLLVADKGITVITIKYPYFVQGLLISIIGITGTVLYLFWLKRNRMKSDKEE
ncbi:6-pyruvoyl-tetrahydropterin synthase-related protein [Anaerocolumna xylanovorans]|uniref:Uncharacterized membrane protein n=1 Tax=Anaerocolumna xylanovorans DSM 12503 TaxID=1121345 RepID=A0A1M7YCA3_9FIRM|nr:6-pyruvoyl-tetrahydropterin synthase-related protein [Anaerocolumna xylanovorans]SHO50243.1 Uncharacterized membrane protein [Anaerocolumna xylanovorans DSM 12503]